MTTRAVTLTAIIRVRPGGEALVGAELEKLAAWVAANEPNTLSYHVGRQADDPAVFLTFERFADVDAMRAHNGSSAVSAFVAAVDGRLASPIEIHVCEELAAYASSS